MKTKKQNISCNYAFENPPTETNCREMIFHVYKSITYFYRPELPIKKQKELEKKHNL